LTTRWQIHQGHTRIQGHPLPPFSDPKAKGDSFDIAAGNEKDQEIRWSFAHQILLRRYLSLEDAAEILEVSESSLAVYAEEDDHGNKWISELDLHKRWGAGDINSRHRPKIGSATRSFDELILVRLLRITYPEASVDTQIPFGRKRVDMSRRTCQNHGV